MSGRPCGDGPRGFEQTSQLLLPVGRCNGLQRQAFDPFQRILAKASASTLQRSQARSQRSVASAVQEAQRFKDAIAQRSSPGSLRSAFSRRVNSGTIDTGHPHCSADPGFCVPVTRLKRKARCNGFRQSGCDRSTILARARFQPCKPSHC
jgi:hypothetical protein